MIIFIFAMNVITFLILNDLDFYLPYKNYFYLFAIFLFAIFCMMFYYGSSFKLANHKKQKPRGVYDSSGLFRVYKGYCKVEYFYLGPERLTYQLLPAELKKNPEEIQKFILECLQTTGLYTQMRPLYGTVLVIILWTLGCVAFLLKMMYGASFLAWVGRGFS